MVLDKYHQITLYGCRVERSFGQTRECKSQTKSYFWSGLAARFRYKVCAVILLTKTDIFTLIVP
jgi:hypothetical protein